MKKADETPVVELERDTQTPTFSKEQVMKSKRYASRKDALSFLLEDNRDYTYAAIDGILKTYMKGKVK